MTEKKTGFKRRLDGVIISDKNNKTIVVNVVRRFQHSKYSKFVHSSKNYHVHDEENKGRIGDKVTIVESRPLSKLKRWVLEKVN